MKQSKPRRLTFRHVEAFRAVSVTGSMTEAAPRLHTSQPQVSRLISQLEAIAGFPLFLRSGSRLTLTLEGSQFANDVDEAFAGLAALEAAAARIRSFGEGRLSVAAMPRLAGGVLASAVAQFKRENPNVLLSIHSADAASVHAWVSSGQCDMGLAMLYGEVTGVRVEVVCRVDCVAIVPHGHPLSRLTHLEPSHFAGQPFISLPAGSPLRRRVDSLFETAQVAPRIGAEASLGASVCALVAAGLGVSLINPLAAAEEHARAGLDILPFEPNIPIDIVQMFPESQKPSLLTSAFAVCARATVLEEVRAKCPGSRTLP